jgi:uncharacterized protein
MIKRLLLGVTATVMVAGVAPAAEIKLEGNNADGVPVVSVRGDFIERDIERFADVTNNLDEAIISFSSNGGRLSAGIEIGTRIRFRGYRTVVADREECYSACALAWLGGTTRYVGREAQVGFHAAYLEKDGRFHETGVGNAVVGGYAANLGLSTAAIMFLTSAPPEGFNRLTEDVARRAGITAMFGDTGRLTEPRRLLIDEERFGGDLPSLRQAAEQGDAEAQFYLGVRYSRGRGVPSDRPEAVRWYRRAAEQGHARAQAQLGQKSSGLADDEAVRWLRLAAEQGYARAQAGLGVRYRDGAGVPQDHAEAVRWLRLAAEQGDRHGLYILATMYYRGDGIPQDYAEAARWYRQAAEQGDSVAQYDLATMYYRGEGVRQDHAEAARWYRPIAEDGGMDAQFSLGNIYYNGRGIQQDHAEAVRWYRRAAEQGHPIAQFNLGISYAEGLGIPQDNVLAHMWFNIAASQSDQDARGNRDIVARRMTSGQLAEAQRLAREWKPECEWEFCK